MSLNYLIYLLVIFGGFIIGLLRYGQLERPYRFLTIYMGYVFLSECASRVVGYYLQNASVVYRIYILVTALFAGALYTLILPRSLFNKLITVFAPASLVASLIIFTIYYTSFHQWPEQWLLLLSLLVVLLSLLQYKNMLQHPVDIPLAKQPKFWLNTGTFLFFSINFFIFGFYDLLLLIPTKYDISVIITTATAYILYATYGFTLWLAGHDKR